VLTANEFVETFGNAQGGQPTTTATNIGRVVDGKVVPEVQWQLLRGVPIVSTPLVNAGNLRGREEGLIAGFSVDRGCVFIRHPKACRNAAWRLRKVG
jgi:hypothetical protein